MDFHSKRQKEKYIESDLENTQIEKDTKQI